MSRGSWVERVARLAGYVGARMDPQTLATARAMDRYDSPRHADDNDECPLNTSTIGVPVHRNATHCTCGLTNTPRTCFGYTPATCGTIGAAVCNETGHRVAPNPFDDHLEANEYE